MTTVQLEQDSTRNISRRYGYLFRLPTTYYSLLFASLPLIGVELIARAAAKESAPVIALFAIVSEVALVLGIELDVYFLRSNGGLATFRRLSTISIMSNLLWFAVSFVGLVVYFATGSEGKIFPLVVLGAFFAICFRAIILGSVFFVNPVQGLPLAIIQPAILLGAAAISTQALSTLSMNVVLAAIGGVIAVVAIEIYLGMLNKPVKGIKALLLLQAFLAAWTTGNPTDLERYFQVSSVERQVTTEMVLLKDSAGEESRPEALLIVPGIHPGPFSPVGSSNLPGDLYSKLRTPEKIPLIFHSISDHDLNLPSKEEVRKYAESLENPQVIEKGNTCTPSIIAKEGKATASGFALGKTLWIALTLAPHGMEDLPEVVRKKIEEESLRSGFDACLVIDAHNSLGEKPDELETENLIQASSRIIRELSNSKQLFFTFGFAHTSEISSLDYPKDIGPAGVGLLFFETKESHFCLVVVDANNSKLGFREEVMDLFQRETSQAILEICTSDTHVTAAKTQNEKGYLALGDITPAQQFATILRILLEKAKSRMAPCTFETSIATSSVRTIGNQAWNNFSGLLDNTILIAKRGAQALGLLAILITLTVALL